MFNIFKNETYLKYIDKKIQLTNNSIDKISAKSLIDNFMNFINEENINYNDNQIYMNNRDSIVTYGYTKTFKFEFLNTFKIITKLKQKQTKIKGKGFSGFYYIKFK